MRWLLRSLLALVAVGALAIIAIVAFVWVLASQQGTAWLLAQLQERAGSIVTIGRVEGSLLDRLVLTDVRVRLPRDEVDIPTISLSWNALAAWSGVLEFEDVRIGPAVYRRLPATGPAAPPSAFTSLIDIRVRDALAESVTLVIADQTVAFGETTLTGGLSGGQLALEQVATQYMDFMLAGQGDLDLGEVINITAQIDWAQPTSEQNLGGRLTVSGDFPVLTVHHELNAPLAIVADGTLTLDGPPSVDLMLQWQDLAVPGVAGLVSPSGTLALAGAIAAYTFDGTGELIVAGETGTFAARGAGQTAALTLESVLFESARGSLTAAGTVAADTRTFDLTVGSSALDPAWFLPDWPGALTGSAMLRGGVTPLELTAEAIDVSGTLRGLPVAATGALVFAQPNVWQLTDVRIASGDSTLALDGQIGSELDQDLSLSVMANIADLSLVQTGLTGSLVADLALAGSLRQPRGTGTVEARRVELAGYAAERLSAAGEFGLSAQDPLNLDIQADRVSRGSIVGEVIRATVTGTPQAHQIAIDATGPRWHTTSTAQGRLDEGLWQGTLATLEIDEMAVGIWRLSEPAAVALSVDSVVVDNSCLVHETGGRWCAQLRVEGRPEDRLVISAQNFQLASLQPLLPPQLTVSGIYQLSASFVDLRGEPRGSVAVSGGPTPLNVAFSSRQAFETELEDLTVGATLLDGRLELIASVTSRENGRVMLDTQIADIRSGDSAISGNLNVFWPDLGFLALLSPDIGEVSGKLDASLQVEGTVNDPQLQGRASWQEGQVAVPAWGLVIGRIDANAASSDGSELTFGASGWVGDSELRVDGTTELDRGAGWPTGLTIRGDSILAVQLPDAEIYVSPDLTVFAELPDVQVTGTVHIPRARVEISQLPGAAIAPSRDAVVHGGEIETEYRSMNVQSDILLTLGEEVEYLGLNLTTKVSGEMRVRRDSDLSTTATGSLMLAGTYNAYGQTLQLERGQLLFNGPLDDPSLDVRAVRVIDTTRVGVELVGTVKAPRTRIFSDPAMAEADALSYLLLGRPVDGAGAGETATLQAAALSMGLQQALPAFQRIGQSLGFDEFTVQTTDTDVGALMAGKYLSPKIYIRYSYGLFNRIGGLLLRFKVNERLSIETRSGDQKSMDLLYTVEKD